MDADGGLYGPISHESMFLGLEDGEAKSNGFGREGYDVSKGSKWVDVML